MNIEMLLTNPWAYLSVAAIYGLMELVKWLVDSKRPALRKAAWFKAFVLTPLPLVFGLVIMALNNILGLELVPGDGWNEETMTAIMMGALAITAQRVAKRRSQ